MSVEELRFFCQVPADISLELLDRAAVSCAHTFERLSDSYGLQCVELSLPVEYLTCRELLYLHFEAWD